MDEVRRMIACPKCRARHEREADERRERYRNSPYRWPRAVRHLWVNWIPDRPQ